MVFAKTDFAHVLLVGVGLIAHNKLQSLMSKTMCAQPIAIFMVFVVLAVVCVSQATLAKIAQFITPVPVMSHALDEEFVRLMVPAFATLLMWEQTADIQHQSPRVHSIAMVMVCVMLVLASVHLVGAAHLAVSCFRAQVTVAPGEFARMANVLVLRGTAELIAVSASQHKQQLAFTIALAEVFAGRDNASALLGTRVMIALQPLLVQTDARSMVFA